jgi:foldase protein PrsA
MLSSISGSPPSSFRMSSLLRKTIPLLLLAFALLATACGSGDAPEVPAGAIAVVGDEEVPKADFDELIAQAERNFEAQKQEFPNAGTPEYENLKNAIVKSLVERAQWEQKGVEMGVRVTEQDVEKRLGEEKERFFAGDEEKYDAELAKLGLTDAQVREELRARILSEKIYKAVTTKVKVTDADVKAYYAKNKAQFQRPQSRDVRHILVKSKARATDIYRQLRSGASFATLAKRFSTDTTSAAQGGKLSAAKGRTVPPFDKFVFAAKKGELSEPIKTEFGWHVIEVLSAVKPAAVTPLAEVEPSIRQTLLQERQSAAMQQWVRDLQAEFEDEVAYAPGYAPPAGSDETTTGAATNG